MHDRVPGSPGRYQAIVSAEEFQKLQNGQKFSITMQRDDQPVKEGTPYSKAAVLPDSVARITCPQIEDPTPADVFRFLADLAMNQPPENLLDNSDFRNPVNERGGDLYVGAYSIDRWRANEYLNVTVRSGYINLGNESESEAQGFVQHLAPEKIPAAGEVVTLACMTHSGELYVGSKKWPASGYITAFGSNLPMSGRLYTNRVAFMIPAGSSEDLIWAALYYGQYTADNLPSYRPKGYGNELRECQRYYWRPRTVHGSGYTYSSSLAYAALTSPAVMRKTPTYIAGDDLVTNIRINGTKHTGSIPITELVMSTNQIRLKLDITDLGIPANEAISVTFVGGLEFSADL